MESDKQIVEVYETNDEHTVNSYIDRLGWVLLMTGRKYDPETKALTIYYSLGRPKGTSTERW